MAEPSDKTPDLVWGPEFEIQWVDALKIAGAQDFLGLEKYKPLLENIYAGLGLPQPTPLDEPSPEASNPASENPAS